MRYIYKNLYFLLIVLFAACSQVANDNADGYERAYVCNAEELDGSGRHYLEASHQWQKFGNTGTRTNEDAHSGTYSLKLTPETPYGFTTDINGIKPDQYICVSVWRKNSNNNGVIIIDGGNGLYHGGKFLAEEHENGWQKIYLEAFIPLNFYEGSVKIFVWNNSKDTVYFDDLEIVVRDKKKYPEYKNAKMINMYIDQSDFGKIHEKRLTAFENQVLVNTDEDYSNLLLFYGNESLNGKYRLKGDLLDHIQGDKWSFRIKLKKGFAWEHLRTFSIQNPLTRHFLYEWLAHKIYDDEDVLTTRYGFIPLRINNKSLGIYAWEEHFEKQLIESRNRREGPILRFDESIFWQRVLEGKTTGKNWNIDYFSAASIIPFKQGQVTSDSLKVMQLEEGQKLMLQYKNHTQPVSKVFDVKKLAQYYALVDITQAYHGFTWHNQRFYYNPVTCLLEPIAFDGYIEGGIYKRFEERITGMVSPVNIADYNKEELLLFQPFTDSLFTQKYLACLERYSSNEFINSVVKKYEAEVDSLSGELKKEFPFYAFNFDYLKSQAQWINENLDEIRNNVIQIGNAVRDVDFGKFVTEYETETNAALVPMMVHAYYDKDRNSISVLNFHNNEVKVLGVFMEGQLPESFSVQPVLKPYNGLVPTKITVNVTGVPTKVLFSVNNLMYETEVFPWKYDETLTTRQQTIKDAQTDLIVEDGSVVFDGEYIFTTDVVIPQEATEVIFKPGTKIDLRKGAGFFSFVPVFINGTAENPVQITSGDNSANGFNVLQPKAKSFMKYAHFSGLSNLRKEGWMTPAAITFYEADLEAENCIFGNNYNCDDALNVVRSDFYVKDSRFENTFADAFDSDFCTGKVENCVFVNTGNDAIDFSGSKIFISGCSMQNISDKAVSGGENSFLKVDDCKIKQANIGIASKDLSQLELKGIEIDGAAYGIMAFVKKPEYGPATVKINDLKMRNVVIPHQIEEGSLLIFNGKKIAGKERNLAKKLYQ